MNHEARPLLDDSSMSRRQIVGVALTGLLSALDGYDVLSLSFAAPVLSREWGIGKAELGLVLSSGLVGMMLGSLALAPVGDRIGRRKVAIICLLLMGIGMLMSAFTVNTGELAVWRVVTGIGIGALVPIITPLAAEFANARRRTLAVTIMAVGFPLGGTLGGFTAAALLRTHGWPAVFLLGALIAALLLALVLRWLPESPAYLLERSQRDRPASVAPYREIFSGAQLLPTLRITAVVVLYMMATYFLLTWMPQMVADAGQSASAASVVSAVASLAGVGACILFGLATPTARLLPVATAVVLAFGLATCVFGLVPPSLVLMIVVAGIGGACMYTGVAGLYTLISATFEARMRVTGTGFVLGIGRAAGAIAPTVAGLLFAAGAGRAGAAVVFGGCALLAGLMLSLTRNSRSA